MNILLLYPRFPDTFWSFRHALKFIDKKATHPLWKLFFGSLFRRPRLFADAITYAIYGYHFRKIFEISL